MTKKEKAFWLTVFLAAGLCLRMNNLGSRSLWTDEFYTLFQSAGHGIQMKGMLDGAGAQNSPRVFRAGELKEYFNPRAGDTLSGVGAALRYSDVHPPLYFWIIHLWTKIFGNSAFAVRFFSVLAGLFCILAAYQVTRYLFGEEAAIFSALFVSISPFCVRYSQEARSYMMVMALGLLAWLFILRIEKHNKAADIFWLAAVNSMGMYTHYLYGIIAVAQFTYITAAKRRDSRILDRFYLAFLLFLLFSAPWFILGGPNLRFAEWALGHPAGISRFYYLICGISRYFFVVDRASISICYLAGSLIILLAAYAAFGAVKDILSVRRSALVFCACLFLLPLLAMFSLDKAVNGILTSQERFWMFPFVGLIPLAGFFLSKIFFRRRAVFYPFVLCMFISSLAASTVQFGPAPKDASLWINGRSAGGNSAVLVYNIRSVVYAQSYYLDGGAYLIPVSSRSQLTGGIAAAAALTDKLFIVRHNNPDDPLLMDMPFMEIRSGESGFKFIDGIYRDGVSVSEYVKCAS